MPRRPQPRRPRPLRGPFTSGVRRPGPCTSGLQRAASAPPVGRRRRAVTPAGPTITVRQTDDRAVAVLRPGRHQRRGIEALPQPRRHPTIMPPRRQATPDHTSPPGHRPLPLPPGSRHGATTGSRQRLQGSVHPAMLRPPHLFFNVGENPPGTGPPWPAPVESASLLQKSRSNQKPSGEWIVAEAGHPALSVIARVDSVRCSSSGDARQRCHKL